MKTAGIIAEFNPFHNGHHYLAMQARRAGATHIVAVMSGSFVQRGEPALLSKWQRAQTALHNGIDLVLELPVLYALGSAERFADGAVALLQATGCLDTLVFGSESGDLPALERAARLCLEAEKSPLLRQLLKEGCSYPTARERAVAQLGGKSVSALLSSPNNTLGIEYLKAMQRRKATFGAQTILRVGASHDGEPEGDFASASWLRRHALAGEELSSYLPVQPADSAPRQSFADPARLEAAILWRLRSMTAEDFSRLPDVTEGLENRLYAAARTAPSVSDFLAAVKTKRYPLARLRRIICYAMLGIRAEDCVKPPAYLRIIGFNDRGKELLRAIDRRCALPLMSSFAELERRFPDFALPEKTATDLQALACAPPAPCGRDYTEKIITTGE